jgi:hypothetical protein
MNYKGLDLLNLRTTYQDVRPPTPPPGPVLLPLVCECCEGWGFHNLDALPEAEAASVREHGRVDDDGFFRCDECSGTGRRLVLPDVWTAHYAPRIANWRAIGRASEGWKS